MWNSTHARLSETIYLSHRDVPIRFCSSTEDYFHIAVITYVWGLSVLIIASEDNRFVRSYPWDMDMSIEEVEKIVADYCFDDWHCGSMNCVKEA